MSSKFLRQIVEKGLWGQEACEREKPLPVCRNVFCLSLGPRNWYGVKFRLWRHHMMGRGLACIPVLASEVWDGGKYLSFIHTVLPLIFLNLSIVNSQFCVCFWYIAKWFFHILFHYSLLQNIEYSSLCYTVGPWKWHLSIYTKSIYWMFQCVNAGTRVYEKTWSSTSRNMQL